MGRYRFVSPDIVRLTLSDGDWIDIKKVLNTGEQRSMLAKTYQSVPGVDGLKLDINQVGLARVMAYLIGWSFCDAAGNGVPLSESAVQNLEPDSFKEIMDAIDAHAEAQEKERTARKNAPAGETA